MRPVIRYELQVYVQTNYEFNSERKHFTQIETKSKRSSIITSYLSHRFFQCYILSDFIQRSHKINRTVKYSYWLN